MMRGLPFLLALSLAWLPAPARGAEPLGSAKVPPEATQGLRVALPGVDLASPGPEPAAEVPLEFSADWIEIAEGGEASCSAEGHVEMQYQGIVVKTDRLFFDRRSLRGVAQGTVRFDFGIYHLKCARLAFDLKKGTAQADDYQAIIEKQGWFGGSRLELSPELISSTEARVSPCTQEDPGYWLAADRFEWYPQAQSWNLRGQWVRLVVGGATVFMLPFFAATIGEAAKKLRFNRIEWPESHIDATVGLDGAQGLYVDSKARYELDPQLPGSVPVRIMSNRGVSMGVVQNFPTKIGQGRFDANYTQYWPWLGPDVQRQGLHLNTDFVHDWGGARSTLDVGYRVDVGRRSDTEYQVDPGGYPIHRLPEFTTTWPTMGLGFLSLTPTARVGYLFDDVKKVGSGVVSGGLGLGLPAWQPARWWSSTFYGGAGSTYYLGDRSQSVLFLGLSNQQPWTPAFGTSFALESQPVYTTGNGTPFDYDRATGVDRLVIGSNLNVYGPWSIGMGAFWSHLHQAPPGTDPIQLGDLYFNVRYNVNCLGFGITLRPPRNGSPFQYLFDYNLAYF